ncbi:MAG: 30S ribosomal protein S6 [Candidatus Cloacimonetes bacterium]|nr:30S ribosomal protein S6 [Candidatus Cloacimonadota bacterium]
MKKSYESMIIIKPLSEEETNQTLDKVKNFLTEHEAEIDNVNIWGLRKLAYEIEKHNEGFYAILYFSLDPSHIKALENFYRLNENIIRFNVIKKEKD